MSEYSCATCGKEFAKKAGLDKHKERKIPCKAPAHLIQSNINQALENAGVSHLEVPLEEFRENSKSFHTSMTKEERQNQGIFFTPKKIRELLFKKLAELQVNPKKILEPSFGSGEFLLDAKRLYASAEIHGVELNESLFKSVKCPGSILSCCNFLSWTGNADLIIGNPPYFVLEAGKTKKEKDEFKEKHSNCMTGRPNIYILFLYKCIIEHLDDNGFLAFILPTSLYNCSYYQPMRDVIQRLTTIQYLENLSKPGFFETGQDTMLMILQKKKLNDNYIYKAKNGKVYFTPLYKELCTLTENTDILENLGLGVKTGNIVWNQERENLSDKGTILIYSHNIRNNELTLNNSSSSEKKQYIQNISKPKEVGPVILVDRGYGNSLRFNCVLVDIKEFYAENHINVIYPKSTSAVANLPRVLKSLKDKRTMEFLNSFIGNGAVSATELETIVPIFP